MHHKKTILFPYSLMIGLAVFVLCSTADAVTNIGVSPGVSSATLQADLNTIGGAGGGTLTFAAGTYNITQALEIGSNTTLTGAGAGSTVLKGPSTGYSWAILEVNANSKLNITIQQMTINGNIAKSESTVGSNPYQNQYGLHFFSPTYASSGNIDVNNVEVLYCCEGIGAGDINGLTVYNSDIHENGLTLTSGLFNHNIYYNTCEYITVNQTQVWGAWVGTGIHLDSNNGSGGHWVVENCSNIQNNASCGVNVQNGVPNVTVTGNVISDNGFGSNVTNVLGFDGLGFTGGASCVISGNTCNGNKGYGIHTISGTGSLTNNYANWNNASNSDGTGNVLLGGTWNPYSGNSWQ